MKNDMKFEVINFENNVVMWTNFKQCIPKIGIIEDMIDNNYKIKINNKIVGKKKIKELMK